MSELKPEIEAVNAVLVATLEPAEFQPSWFAAENIVFRKEELASAKIDVIFRDAVSFSVDALRVDVTRERFAAYATKHSAYELLRDLVVSTFRLRSTTPVRAMGLNREFHFRMPTEDAAHAVGHTLAPKKPWAGILDEPGLRSLQMQGKRPDSRNGYVLVRLDPSPEIVPGIYVHVNDHFEFNPPDGARAIDTLESVWRESLERSYQIASALVNLR